MWAFVNGKFQDLVIKINVTEEFLLLLNKRKRSALYLSDDLPYI